MARALLFNIPATGHINPSLAVVSEMVRQGEEVIYVNTEDTRKSIEPTGASFRPYPFAREAEGVIAGAGGGNIARNAVRLWEVAARLLPWVSETIRETRPDYVIFDSLCSWARLAAQQSSIPAAALISTFALNIRAMGAIPPGILVNILTSFTKNMPAYWQVARRIRAQGAKPNGLPGAVMNTGALNIVFTSADFQPGAAAFDKSYRFVGPSIGKRGAQPEFPFDQITRSPVVYISLGTINNQNLTFYRQCFEALRDHSGQFILSAGQSTDLHALEPIPANFIVKNFVPQLEILERADLFITHGGLNSVSEGLYYGVPLVVVPQQFEQAIVAQQVVKCGAGVAIGDRSPYGKVTVEELRGTVNEVLGNWERYRAAAGRLGESFRQAGGYQRAAQELIAFGRNGQG